MLSTIPQITIATCNFNTTQLTNNLLDSISLHFNSCEYNLIILDNSDVTQFKLDSTITTNTKCTNIQIIDNFKSKLLDFDKVLANSPYKLMPHNTNHYGSLKHAYSIQFLLDVCKTQFLLLFDSDTILLRDIDFISNDYITVADIEEYGKNDPRMNNKKYLSKTRFMPFIQLFNITKIRSHDIRYFDYSRIHGILAPRRGNYYDTGASFYEDINKNSLSYKQIIYGNYIYHIDHGSWSKYLLKK